MAGDVHFSSVALLIDADAALVDRSSYARAIVAAGAAASSATGPKFGAGCISIASGYVEAAGMAFGTGDFTVEWWNFYVGAVTTNATLFDNRFGASSNSLVLYQPGGAAPTLFCNGADRIAAATPFVANSYQHVAISRAAGITRLFIGGQLQGSYVDANNYGHSGIRWGNNYLNNAGAMNGRMDDVRVTVGVGRYTENFVPPLVAFPVAGIAAGTGPAADPLMAQVVSLLHFDGANASNVFVDQRGKVWTAKGNAKISTAQSKWGGSSGLFDGAGDYLTTPAHADFNFGAGDFTIEGWLYQIANNTGTQFGGSWYQLVIGQAQLGTAGNASFSVSLKAGVVEASLYQGGLNKTVPVTGALTLSQWHHLAFVRYGGTLFVFINGEQRGSLAFAGATTASTRVISIAADDIGQGSFNGHLEEFRITKGVARYTANFVPPAAPFLNKAPLIATTWNPSDKGDGVVLSNGNLTESSSITGSVRSTFSAKTGKYYFEATAGTNTLIGVGTAAAKITGADAYPGVDVNGWSVWTNTGNKYNGGSQGAYAGAIAAGTVIGVKVDLDNRQLSYTVAGVDKGLAFTLPPDVVLYAMVGGGNATADSCTANFGAAPFTYPVPAGFAPGFGPGNLTLAGTVKSAADAFVARLVRAYREDTGALVQSAVSNAADGSFELFTTYPGTHSLEAMPADGEALAALLVSGVLPL